MDHPERAERIGGSSWVAAGFPDKEGGMTSLVESPAGRTSPDQRVWVRGSAAIKMHGGMSEEAAHQHKRERLAEKRYVRDVY
jgi:sulfite reductase (NADPH) flavoprotein alpha-component